MPKRAIRKTTTPRIMLDFFIMKMNFYKGTICDVSSNIRADSIKTANLSFLNGLSCLSVVFPANGFN